MNELKLEYVNSQIKSKNTKAIETIKLFIPVFSVIICLLVDILVPLNKKILTKTENYLTYFLIILLISFLIITVVSITNNKFRKKFLVKAPFIGGMLCFLNIYNIVTGKLLLIPQIYFPYPDRILAVFVKSREILTLSVLFSIRLQIMGLLIGLIFGLITGITIGWSKRIGYWLHPVIKLLGPIPATAWIPIALVVFPTSYGASVFMVSLSVWFPITVLSSSGIQNVEQAYFEVSKTMGASNLYQIFHVAIPAAMPTIFIGMFNGICASFISLMVAETLGVKYGIGWYINWQREVMAYPNVYAGLIIIAVFCYCFISILFKFRDKLLVWQKGIIKW